MYIRPVFSSGSEQFLRITHIEWHVKTEQLWFCFSEVRVLLPTSEFLYVFVGLGGQRTCLAYGQ